jgi:hypothetical protein
MLVVKRRRVQSPNSAIAHPPIVWWEIETKLDMNEAAAAAAAAARQDFDLDEKVDS